MTETTTTQPETEASAHPFLVAGNFSYTARVRRLQRPAGHFNLLIASRWGGARNPQDEQVVLNLTLTGKELSALSAVLQDALQAGANELPAVRA